MTDKNNFTKQELNTLVAASLVEVKEIKTGVEEIKKEIILDKESREQWLSEIQNEVKSLVKSKEDSSSTNSIFNLENKEIQALIEALSIKIYENIIRWADEKNNANRAGGKITINEFLQKIYDQQSEHFDQYIKDRKLFISYTTKKEDTSSDKFSNRITELKNNVRAFYKDKFPLWIRNPYKVTAIIFIVTYFVLSCFSWIRWHQYSTANVRLQKIEAIYEVDKAIIQELNPQLSITLSGYEKLTDQFGKEETLEIFKDKIQELNRKKAP